MIDARVAEVKREVSQKLDRNEDKVDRLSDLVQNEFRNVRDDLAAAKSALAAAKGEKDYRQWIFPTLCGVATLGVGIMELLKH